MFDGEIRHRTLRDSDSSVVYGMHFDPGRETDPRFAQLRRYVRSRVTELRATGNCPHLPAEEA